ncbi:MAG: PQQ-binding-like beta-propeller repeat protein [Vicinamibacteria bacterium]|nr:PQQ-binding-like beta-propeller repeat protein [Vicinamibacteria bacterium]
MRTVLVLLLAVAPLSAQQWPQFRGAATAGVAATAVPTTWNLAANTGVVWKTPIAGLGHSSPIVWDDRVFVTTATSAAPNPQLDIRHSGISMAADDGRQTWTVVALDRATGKVVWEQAAFEGVPRVKRHLKASHASATPATDGQYVVALFGSEGLYCYDFAGRLLWKQDLGVMNTGLVGDEGVQWGPASSPIIHGPLVIVQNDRQRESFLAAYELKSGEQVWKVERDEFPSWATPLVTTVNGRSELVVNASKFIRAYDPMTGRELWRLPDAETQVKVASPVAGPGMVIVTGGYPRGSHPIYAIRPQQQGAIDATGTAGFSWRLDRGSPYVPTPLVYGTEIYVLADNGVLAAYDVATGARLYQQRLDETPLGFSASPIGAGGYVYLASEDGDVFVVKAGRTFELVARNDMNEALMATPAVAGGMLIIRGRSHLFAIG